MPIALAADPVSLMRGAVSAERRPASPGGAATVAPSKVQIGRCLGMTILAC